MSKEVALREPTDVYVAPPGADARTEAVMRRSMSGAYREFGSLVMFNPPSDDDRRALATRLRTLVDSLQFEKNKVRALIAEMLKGYRHRGVKSTENSLVVTDLYVRELALEPPIAPWAVWRACAAIRTWNDPARLETHGIRLYEAPTTMAMRRLCDSYVWDTRAEMGTISAILQGKQAQPETAPEVREALGKRMREFADEMKARIAPDDLNAPPPIPEEKMIEMAGGEEAWASIPARKEYGKSKQMAAFAKKIAEGLAT